MAHANKFWDLKQVIERRAKDVQWAWLANHRYHFDGLQTGRDGRGDNFGYKLKGKSKGNGMYYRRMEYLRRGGLIRDTKQKRVVLIVEHRLQISSTSFGNAEK